MPDPAKIVPPLVALIFVGALVALLWGNQLGIIDFVRGIPPYVLFGIVIAFVLVQWKTQKEGTPFGWWRVAIIAVVSMLLVGSLVNGWRL
jgi:hypothetical protein